MDALAIGGQVAFALNSFRAVALVLIANPR
jgi:hypothetical protein